MEQLKSELKVFEDKVSEILLHLPNKCHADVPLGTSSEENVVVHTEGSPSRFSFQVRSHVEIGGQSLDLKKPLKFLALVLVF